MTWRARWVAVATAGAAAAYVILFRLGGDGRDMPAWDVYAHFYPNILYALDAIRDGGRGLLWNPLQNCGEPEHLLLRVDAPERGFLFLSDQYLPGWRATIDGRPTAIIRANYAFRLVEVPRGRSLVEFRYAPASVRIGAAVSGATVIALAMFLWSTRRRHPPPGDLANGNPREPHRLPEDGLALHGTSTTMPPFDARVRSRGSPSSSACNRT